LRLTGTPQIRMPFRATPRNTWRISRIRYTSITRGKRLVVVVGQRKALAIAVRNNKTEQRFSGLLVRLLVSS
jgi:hypothetical protein